MIWAGAALAIILIALAVFVFLRSRRNETTTAQTSNTTAPGLDQDLYELLEQLPPEQRNLMSRMIEAHNKMSRELRSLGTNVIGEATPLTLESWRLSEHLERHDIHKLIHDAATQPGLRPLADDMVRMNERQDELMEVLGRTANSLEKADANELSALQEELRRT